MPKRTNSRSVSGNPAKHHSTVQQWKRGIGAVSLDLPSGNTCLAKRVGMQEFMKTEAVPDRLGSFLREMAAEARVDELGLEIIKDMNLLWQIEQVMDRALVLTVVQPQVQLPPGCAHEGCGRYLNFRDGVHNRATSDFQHDYVPPDRDDEVLYADDVDLQDKLFIFNWTVGGSSNIDAFHQRWAEAMAAVGLTQQANPVGVN